MLAVGEQVWGTVDDRICRMCSGLAGGLGRSQQELCGALSGGTMMIGALYGRTSAAENDDECLERASRYRERFIQEFGTTRCSDLREGGYGSEGEWPCSILVERATRILWPVLTE